VYIYIEIKFDFNLERDKIAQFLQNLRLNLDKKYNTGTKLRMWIHVALSLPRGTSST